MISILSQSFSSIGGLQVGEFNYCRCREVKVVPPLYGPKHMLLLWNTISHDPDIVWSSNFVEMKALSELQTLLRVALSSTAFFNFNLKPFGDKSKNRKNRAFWPKRFGVVPWSLNPRARVSFPGYDYRGPVFSARNLNSTEKPPFKSKMYKSRAFRK